MGAVAAAFVDLPQRQRAVLAAVQLGGGFGEGVGVFDAGVGVGEAVLGEVWVSGPTGAKTTPGLSELNGRVRHQG